MSITAHELELVRAVAREIVKGLAPRHMPPTVELHHGELVITSPNGRIVERYDTAEEAITALRASWAPK